MLLEPRQGPLGRGARHRPRIHHHESDKCGPQRGRNLVRVKRAGDEHKFGPGGGAVGESNLAFVSTEEHHDVGGDEVGGTEQTHETVCGVRELTSLDQGLNEEGSRGALVAAWVGEVLHLAEKICAEEAWDVGPGGGQGGLSLLEGV